jgi:hypothetical protein
MAKNSLENAGQSRYLGMALTNQNCSHEEIKGRLNSGNARYHLVQKLLLSHLLIKENTMILLVILYGCETWSVTLKRNIG